MVSLPRCPVCDALVDPAKTPAMPFCSGRCQQIDLGRWLDEGYSVPVDKDEDESEDHPDNPVD